MIAKIWQDYCEQIFLNVISCPENVSVLFKCKMFVNSLLHFQIMGCSLPNYSVAQNLYSFIFSFSLLEQIHEKKKEKELNWPKMDLSDYLAGAQKDTKLYQLLQEVLIVCTEILYGHKYEFQGKNWCLPINQTYCLSSILREAIYMNFTPNLNTACMKFSLLLKSSWIPSFCCCQTVISIYFSTLAKGFKATMASLTIHLYIF